MNIPLARLAVVFAAAASLAGVAACVSLPSSSAPPIRLFTLPPLVADPASSRRAPGTLRVDEPMVAAPYRGTFVAIRDGAHPNEIRYSREARFAASLGNLLGERLADVATIGGAFDGVRYPGQAGSADWKLHGRVEIFECRADGSAFEAHVAASFSLERVRGGDLVFSRRYEEPSPIPSNDSAVVVEELGHAFDRLAVRAIADAAEAASTAPAVPAGPPKSL